MQDSTILRIVASLLISLPVLQSFAYTPQFCFEDETDMCGLASGNATEIFLGVMEPLESQVPGFSMIIFWGGILAMIWFKTENIMLLAVVGIFVNATIVGLSSTAQGIGLAMLVVANGILLFQLVRQRISLFT